MGVFHFFFLNYTISTKLRKTSLYSLREILQEHRIKYVQII